MIEIRSADDILEGVVDTWRNHPDNMSDQTAEEALDEIKLELCTSLRSYIFGTLKMPARNMPGIDHKTIDNRIKGYFGQRKKEDV